MLVHLRNIGNSKGIILSKSIIQECHIRNEVDLRVENGVIIMSPNNPSLRKNWKAQFKAAGAPHKDDEIILDGINNESDKEEWTW